MNECLPDACVAVFRTGLGSCLTNAEKCYHRPLKFLFGFRPFPVFRFDSSNGSSMGSRKNRGRRQTHPLEEPKLKNQPPSATTPKIPFWQRSHALLWTILGGLAILGTLLEVYPWLSIQDTGMLNPSNPYSELFLVVNEGYVPVTNLNAECNISFQSSTGAVFRNNTVIFRNFADYLAHEGRVTAPCFGSVEEIHSHILPSVRIGDALPGSRLTIKITYAFSYLNIGVLRRSQRFRFQSIASKDNSQRWEFISAPK